MRGTTAPRLLLELIVARMLLPGADESTGALLQRLERMERRLGAAADVRRDRRSSRRYAQRPRRPPRSRQAPRAHGVAQPRPEPARRPVRSWPGLRARAIRPSTAAASDASGGVAAAPVSSAPPQQCTGQRCAGWSEPAPRPLTTGLRRGSPGGPEQAARARRGRRAAGLGRGARPWCGAQQSAGRGRRA